MSFVKQQQWTPLYVTPLHAAAKSGDVNKVRELLEGGKYDVNCIDSRGWTPLRYAADGGHSDVVRMLISEFRADIKFDEHTNDHDKIPLLHVAAARGHLGVIRVLISEFKADVNTPNNFGVTLLHVAASCGHLTVIRVLVSEFGAHVDKHANSGETPLHRAASYGRLDVVRVLLEFKASVNARTDSGETPLHRAADRGHVDVVRVLVLEFQADVSAHTDCGRTPLYWTAARGRLDIVRELISEFKVDVIACSSSGSTPLHLAAEGGHLSVVRMLVSEFKADVNARNTWGDTAFYMAINNNKEEVALALMNEFHCDTKGGTPYIHKACRSGWVNMVRALIQKHGTGILKDDVNTSTDNGKTLFDAAVTSINEEVPLALMNEFHCDTKGGTPYIHIACGRGWVNLVRALVQKHGTSILKDDVNAAVSNSNKLFDMAVDNKSEEVAVALMKEFHCDTKGGTPYIHTACERGWVNLVRALVQEHGTDILNYGGKDYTLLHDVVANSNAVAEMLVKEFGSSVKGLLHVACEKDNVSLVWTLIHECKADVTATDNKGRSSLHSACASNNGSLVRLVSQHVSPWVADDSGDTPLHVCARLGNTDCVQALLELDPPVLIRNNLGQTAKDLEEKLTPASYGYISAYMEKNKGAIYTQYEVVQRHAKKKYSLPEPITRAFVVGNPGAGKSSLVETLKREGLLTHLKGCQNPLFPPPPPPPHCRYSPKHPHQ